MSKSAGGQRSTQASTQSLDGTTQDYLKQIMQWAQHAGAAGPSPLVGGATDYNTATMDAGRTGLGALAGDPSAVSKLMNPYQTNVIDAMRKEGAVTDQNTINTLNDAATRAGAFGGTRQGVATGVALAQNARDLNSNIAGLLNTGYDNTMNRAGNLAGMGFAGAGANANLGMGGIGSPQQWMLQMLKRGFLMPTGSQSNTSGSTLGTQAGFSIPFLSGGSGQ